MAVGVSQYFEADGSVLWNPSTKRAAAFLEAVHRLEAELGILSGIGSMCADESQINTAELDHFARAVASRGLVSEGAIQVVALAYRANLDMRWPEATDPKEVRTRKLARDALHGLPR
jgi:hypothetical protein